MINHAHDVASSAESQAEVLKEQALELAAVARERFGNGARIVKDFTIKEPTKALGIALGVGVFLGWLIKRR
jgi:ElaB/YqjD/DUF883 family membrane-anchored ribosome-binding protein